MSFFNPFDIGQTASDAWKGAKGVVGGVTGWAGDRVDDFGNSGQNRYQPQNFGTPDIQYGGKYGPDSLADYGIKRSQQDQTAQNWQQNQMYADRGPQAQENGSLSQGWQNANGGDMSGALQLAREGAMGQSPSQAAYLMQSGLDQALAGQQAQMGGARSNAGIALGGANAMANSANLQNQAYTAAGAQRAGEMANYTGMYGGLANQNVNNQQQRLNSGNQMSQFNAGLNDQYRLGMGGLANQTGANGLGWYNGVNGMYGTAQQGQLGAAQIGSSNAQNYQDTASGLAAANAAAKAGQGDKAWGLLGTGMGIGGQFIPKPGGGGTPPPT